jgi:hypothetical protein
MDEGISKDLAKHWWLHCIACSEASITTQMRGFGIEEPAYEQALHAFSGGFMHLGHACGLLTGAALAAGFLSRARFDDDDTRSAAALDATIQIAKAHPELTGSVNCREITKVSLSKLSGRLRYLQQGKGRLCGRLHIKWAFQAHELIKKTLTKFSERKQVKGCTNCAVQTLRKMVSSVGMKAEDSVLVAGLAGGVGLLGNVCGAMAASVFALSATKYLRQNGKKRDSQVRGAFQELAGTNYRGPATRLRHAFIDRFGSELCSKIIRRHFQDIADHSAFIEQGGCQATIEFIADWILHRSENEPRTTHT